MELNEKINAAADVIRKYQNGGLAFTGAGISVESGIPPFRGADGLWSKVDPSFIELNYFYAHPENSWQKIRELFYDHWGKAAPNSAHYALTQLWKKKFIQAVVTQNIDCLHQRSGMPAEKVIEFHGTLDQLVCSKCSVHYGPDRILIDQSRPTCPKCGGLLKPDFVFFSEDIPVHALETSFELAEHCKWCLVIGTTGEVMPACEVPRAAKRSGAIIIEINPSPSAFTGTLTDIFIPGKAGEVMDALLQELKIS